MKIDHSRLSASNDADLKNHNREFEFLSEKLSASGTDTTSLLENLSRLQIAVPSWALGSGGTRFGRFPIGGQPRNLEEKLEDIGVLHQLTRMAGRVSLHIPWDVLDNLDHIKSVATNLGLTFDAMNSNTFQDQDNQ